MALRLNVGNLSQVSDAYPVIEEGVYKAQINSIRTATSKQGNPMVEVDLSIVDHPEYMGHKLFDRIATVERALWRLKQFCVAAGLEWDETGVDLEPAIGRTVTVKVIQELYSPPNGEPRRTNRVDAYVRE